MKGFLEIKEISYGEFPEILGLNPRFKPGGKKVKVVLDVQAPEIQKGNPDISSIFMKLIKLLPSLERHQCGEHLLEDIKSGKKGSYSEHSEKITDIAHIMEHVIIDLQSKITGMDSCSGITCGYKDPYFRFDLFVECKDKKVGMFSARFAADLLKRLLTNKSLSRRYYALIDLAQYLYGNNSLQRQTKIDPLASQISLEFGWKKRFVLPLLRKLQDFGFLNLKHSIAT
ncbi:MAG: hypothetical protein KAW02_07065 [candidate division Zixibacteria bacterium]|nr:hypothetical protein [candidate division Zixibacteria bacterium]